MTLGTRRTRRLRALLPLLPGARTLRVVAEAAPVSPPEMSTPEDGAFVACRTISNSDGFTIR